MESRNFQISTRYFNRTSWFRIFHIHISHNLQLIKTIMSNPSTVDLNSLEPQQLVEFRKSIDQEINHFTQSLQALQTAQSKLRECISSINNLEKSSSDDLLIPLTSSLYLPGKSIKKNEFLVDIGTGYFVEKLAKDAKQVYDYKITKLNDDGRKLKDILVQKNEILNSVNLVLRKKMIEYESQQEAAAEQQKVSA